jgi:hypothetical protein
MRLCLLLGLLCVVLGAAGCGEPGSVSRVGFALTIPAANASEVRSLGYFAVSLVAPEFECEEYLSGGRDPIAQTPQTLVASDYQNVGEAADGDVVEFKAVPEGELSIIVEAYDSGGSRIFLGCAPATVVAGERTEIEMTLVEDPAAL